MKALTLTQPYASLIAIGAKKIETRSWSTAYRGPLAIHAGKGLGPVGSRRGMIRLCRSSPFDQALDAAGIWSATAIDHVPYGAIVAVCRLTAVARIVQDIPRGETVLHLADDWMSIGAQERAFGNYSPGRSAWLLADVRRLPAPIPYRGALSLWNVPPDVARQIEEQL
jgi:activating signal cointegrator 1